MERPCCLFRLIADLNIVFGILGLRQLCLVIGQLIGKCLCFDKILALTQRQGILQALQILAGLIVQLLRRLNLQPSHLESQHLVAL